MAQEPISLILLEPVIESVDALVRVLEKSKQVEIPPVPTAAEALQVAQQFQPCIVFVSIRGSLDGTSQLDFLKKLEKPIRAGQVKPLVVSSVKNHPLARQIAAIGVTDYTEEPIPVKSLLFKVNLLIKAVLSARERAEKKLALEEKLVFKAKIESKEVESQLVAEYPAHFKEALQLGEDIFLFKRSLPKKMGKNYILEAEGPSPETGAWEQIAGSAEEEKEKWKWVPRKDLGGQEESSGAEWVHEGEKPDFDARSGKWRMKSERPALYLEKEGKRLGTKVETESEGNVSIAEDSATARDNLMLNKTLAAQAREEIVKKVFEAQKKEEDERRKAEEEKKAQKEIRKKLAGGTKEEDKEERMLGDVPDEHEEEIRALKKRLKNSKEEGSEHKDSNSESEEEKENQREIADFSEEKGAWKAGKGRKEKESKREVELSFQEESLKGLREEDLVGRQNLRNREGRDLKGRITQEESAEGLSGAQLRSEKNVNRRKQDRDLRDLLQDEDDSEARRREKKTRREEDCAEREPAGSDETAREESVSERTKLARAEEKARKRIEKLKREAREEAARPLREEISQEEERKLRHELGIEDGEEISSRELDRRARLDKLKSVRKELHDVQEGLEGRGVPLLAMFPPDEEGELGQLERHESADKRNFRAMESVEEAAGVEEDGRIGFTKTEARKRGEKSRKEEEGEDAELFYVPRVDVQPIEGSWESEDGFWIYLPNEVFVNGLPPGADPLPTWVFEGDVEPALEETEARWRFEGSPPRLITEREELPRSLRNLLENLERQADLANGIDPEMRAKLRIPEREKSKKETSNKLRSEVEPENEAGSTTARDEERGRMSSDELLEEQELQKQEGTVSLLEEEDSGFGKVSSAENKRKSRGGRAIRKADSLEQLGEVILDEEDPGFGEVESEEVST